MTDLLGSKTSVEFIRQCAPDVGDMCELKLAAIALETASPENSDVQIVRGTLASVACLDCRIQHLANVEPVA